jgi:DNA-binding GntR family transcriptional regulator
MTNRQTYQTKNEYVEESLRDAISRGELRPGMWIRSEEWASRLNTSLTPIREALRKLEADGLLRIYPHRGARVVGISRAEFEEVYQMRAALEGLAAARAVSQLDERGIQDLVEELERLQESINTTIAEGRIGALRDLNKQFHFAMYNRGESPRVCRLIDNLWMTFPWDTLALAPGRPPQTISEHEAIIEAVRAGDAAATRTAVTVHIERSADALLQAESELGLTVFHEEDGSH